ncbi:MAG: hypothetical protein ACRDBO_00270 [Lachnospiraceae bacterium]
MEYGVTEKGFVLQRFDECVDQLREKIKEYTGIDLTTNEQAYLNLAFVYPIADVVASLHEENQDVYYSFSPSSAIGVSLDNVCQSSNIIRAAAKKTSYIIHCNCLDGTTIVSGTTVAADTNPRYEVVCEKNTLIARSAFNEAYIRVITAEVWKEYIITIDGKRYIFTASTDKTEDILRGLQLAIDDNAFRVEVTGELLAIRSTDNSRVSELSLSDNLTTDSITGLAKFQAKDYNSTILPVGSIVKIITNLSTGLSWVENRLLGTAGRELAEDWELRQSFISQKYANSRSLTESTVSYLLKNVYGVTAAKGYQNDEDEVDHNGLLPHSVMYVVEGGNDEEIARGILATKTGGINTNGSISVTVLGENDEPIDIRFNRPEYLYTWLRVEISGVAGEIDPAYEVKAKELILEKTDILVMGDKLILQILMQNIFSSVAGVEYIDIAAGTSTNKDIPPKEYNRQNIVASKMQRISVGVDRIEVVFNEL